MNSTHINDTAELLKALAHPTRIQIVHELLKGIRCVTDIQDILPATQSNVSQHLTVLRHARVVDFVQDGAQRCYYISRPKTVQAIVTALADDEPVLRKSKQDIVQEKEQTMAACGVCCGV
jgi:DNA-binding transcriptional ArsR family regulator